jgi:2-dehydropantoate 2-reductase
MKIAVVGCGAVGSYYGAILCRAGHDVHFLLRSDYEVVRRDGVRIHSPAGDFQARPRSARAPEEIGPSDLVLIGLKTTANHQFARLLPPLVGSATAVVTLQNGLGNIETLARIFPAEQLLGGLCFVCLNRVAPGVIRHLRYGRIVLGEFQRPAQPRTLNLTSCFASAGLDCKVTDDLARAHWEKLIWNIPFNGLGVAGSVGYDAFQGAGPGPELPPPGPCLATDLLLGDPRWESLVVDLMREVIRTGQTLGFPIPESLAAKQIELTRTMGAYKASTLIDFERGRPLELESLFLEPCRRARHAGVAVPRLERLCRILESLDPGTARTGHGLGTD